MDSRITHLDTLVGPDERTIRINDVCEDFKKAMHSNRQIINTDTIRIYNQHNGRIVIHCEYMSDSENVITYEYDSYRMICHSPEKIRTEAKALLIMGIYIKPIPWEVL